ncbi:MAG: ABC transporter substrate-binding protein [Planctomycetes bacterium]|nr:ABC transporter substrate-binding protein [Planctomycetota bacterium]
MNRSNMLNMVVIVLLIGISLGLSIYYSADQGTASVQVIEDKMVALAPIASEQNLLQRWAVKDASGQWCVRDASSQLVPIHSYQRIVCLSSAVDAFLVPLLEGRELHRLAGCSTYSRGKQYAEKLLDVPDFRNAKELEAILLVKPDLVIIPTSVADVSQMNRLREAGLTVYNIGESRGFESFCTFSGQISVLIKNAEKGEEIIGQYIQRIESLQRIEITDAPTALYLSAYSGNYYGGVSGSSYHDVIRIAGLKDAASSQQWKSSWPQYSVEQLFILNPDYIICNTGMKKTLLAQDALGALHAVKNDRFIEIESNILNDPGFFIYDAAQIVQQRGLRDRQ